MSKVVKFTIDSILKGISPTYFTSENGYYLSGIAIDPDLPINPASATSIRTGGTITPIGYTEFSTTGVINTPPIAIITCPKTELVYVITNGGKIISYSNTFASETAIGTVAGSNAEGAAYYNNYIYIFGTGNSKNDVSRFGPLDGSAAIVDAWWSGLSLTTLTNTTYPVFRQARLPNHWGHVHSDNALYFCDYAGGQGLIHKIKTKKTTVEGDTNDGSAYNVLDLPFGMYPTDIESLGTDLVVAAHSSTSGVLNQGNAKLFFWDTFSDSFYNTVNLYDPFATALLNSNNILYAWSGNSVKGCRVSAYDGARSMKQLFLLEEGYSPFPGSVASYGERISWGGYTTYTASSPSVWSFGSKESRLPVGLHNTAAAPLIGDNFIVTAIGYVQQSSSVLPKLIIGRADNVSNGLSQFSSSATLASYFRSEIFTTGRKFIIREIKINFTHAVQSGSIVTPIISVDAGSSSFSIPIINNTNYPSQFNIVYKNPSMSSSTNTPISGSHDFYLQLAWTGTDPISISLPIEITVEIYDDEPAIK